MSVASGISGTTWRIAWRTLGRNKKRTALALMSIAVGQWALLITMGIMHGYVDNIEKALTGPSMGHIQVHQYEWREERAADLVIDDVNAICEVITNDERVMNAGARIYAPVLVAPVQDAFTGVVVGVDITAESDDYGLLSGLEQTLQPRHVILGYRLARKIDAAKGQEIAVVGQGSDGSIANDLYIVQDIIKCPVDIVNQLGIVMSLADAQELFYMHDQAHEIVIRTVLSDDAKPVAARLAHDPLVGSFEVLTWKEIAPEWVMMLKMIDYVGYFVLIIMFIAAIAGIANTLMMSTFERIHEFGMLLALGTRPTRIVHMIVLEAVLLGLVGVLLGTALGLGTVGIASQTGIDIASLGGEQTEDIAFQGLKLPLYIFPRSEPLDIVMGLIAILFTALVASIWPASLAAKLEPIRALRS